jgi:hypothetical protein
LRCFLEIIEGASLLRSRLNYLFNALHWQVDETARQLTAYGRHITGRPRARGRTNHRVEPTFLFIAQRVIEPRKGTADNVVGGRRADLFGRDFNRRPDNACIGSCCGRRRLARAGTLACAV